jgi:hypothetical protein
MSKCGERYFGPKERTEQEDEKKWYNKESRSLINLFICILLNDCVSNREYIESYDYMILNAE